MATGSDFSKSFNIDSNSSLSQESNLASGIDSTESNILLEKTATEVDIEEMKTVIDSYSQNLNNQTGLEDNSVIKGDGTKDQESKGSDDEKSKRFIELCKKMLRSDFAENFAKKIGYKGFVLKILTNTIEKRLKEINMDKVEYKNKIESVLLLFLYGGANLKYVFERKRKSTVLNEIEMFLINMNIEYGYIKSKDLQNNTITIYRIVSLYAKELYQITKLAKDAGKKSKLHRILTRNIPITIKSSTDQNLLLVELLFPSMPSIMFNKFWLFSYMVVLSQVIYNYHIAVSIREKPVVIDIIRWKVAASTSDLYRIKYRFDLTVNNNYLNYNNNIITINRCFFEHFIQMCLIAPDEVVELENEIVKGLDIEDDIQPINNIMEILIGENHIKKEDFQKIWKLNNKEFKSSTLNDFSMKYEQPEFNDGLEEELELSIETINQVADQLIY